PIAIGLGVAGLLAAGAFMVVHADAQVSTTALTASAKLVTVVQAKATTYRASRTYVATIEPWVEAKIGPQLVSAYVDTVLVRSAGCVARLDRRSPHRAHHWRGARDRFRRRLSGHEGLGPRAGHEQGHGGDHLTPCARGRSRYAHASFRARRVRPRAHHSGGNHRRASHRGRAA